MDDKSIKNGTDVERRMSICDQWRLDYQLQKQYQRTAREEKRYGVLREIPNQGFSIEVVDERGRVYGSVPIRLVFLFRYIKEALQNVNCPILRTRSIPDVPVVDVGCLRAAIVLEMDYRTLPRWDAYVCRMGRRAERVGLGQAIHTEVALVVSELSLMHHLASHNKDLA